MTYFDEYKIKKHNVRYTYQLLAGMGRNGPPIIYIRVTKAAIKSVDHLPLAVFLIKLHKALIYLYFLSYGIFQAIERLLLSITTTILSIWSYHKLFVMII